MAENSIHSELSLDIILEILFNLRVKTLCKFKWVCKSWSSLISSSGFQDEYSNRHSNQNPLLLTTQGDNDESGKGYFRFTVYDNNTERKFWKAVPYIWRLLSPQSCRGLVCLGSFPIRNLFILNPSIEELIILPQVQGRYQCCFGLGFTHLTQEFKVVLFSRNYHGVQTHCEVFTLGTNYWREVKNPPPFADMEGTPFVNGAFHLLPSHPEANYISAFNVETEDYKEILVPESYDRFVAEHGMRNIYLKELEGSLCLTLCFPWRVEIWLLIGNNEEWTNKYTIRMSSLDGHFSQSYQTYPLRIMGDGSIILNISMMDRTKLLRYDPEQKVITETICEFCNSRVAYFVESFLPLGER